MADEYIRKQDAVEALDGKIIVTGHKNADTVLQHMKDISNKIKSLKPADVVQVVHGRWMSQKGGGLCCSECGGYALDEPDGNFIHVAVPSKFCPNCGAKMDGGK